MGHEMIRRALTRLSIADFATLIANINGATKQVPENGTIAERALRLIEWAESHGGPGLDKVERVAGDVLTEFSKSSFASAPIFLVPHRRNPYFTGREDELETLHRTLNDENRAALGQAISGLGGIGKTQTAVVYAYEYRDEYQAVLWSQAENSEQLVSGFTAIADKLNLPYGKGDSTEAVQATVSWLTSKDGWLLVLDNADNPELVKPFLPVDLTGHVLLTSRATVFDVLGIRPLKLDILSAKDARKFLLDRTDQTKPSDAERQSAEDLGDQLGYLPLALEQAGAYMLAKKMSVARYLERLKQQPVPTLEKKAPVTGDYPLTVAKTWQINIDELSEPQRDLIQVSSFLAPDHIPFELIELGKEHLGKPIATALAEETVHDLCEPLHRYSLISVDTDETYSVHRMVQEVTKHTLDDYERRSWAEQAMQAINAALPIVELENWEKCERLIPHAQIASRMIAEHGFASEEAGRLLHQTGYYLQERGRYSFVEPLYQQALEIRRKVLGEEHPSFADSCNNLAGLYRATGRYQEAEPLYKQALEIRRKVLGEEHPNFAQSCNNLAGLYRVMGRYEEAEPLLGQDLKIRRKVLGEEHPDFATGCNDLAVLYGDTGRCEEAEPLLKQALEIRRKVLGEEHPDFAQSCNNLAGLYRVTGRYEEAEPLFEQDLEICRKVLGEEHPDFATSCNNLAGLYRVTGRYEEAEPLYQQALEIRRNVLGEEHPDFAQSCNNLALLYGNMGRYEEAELLLKQALKIRRKVLGDEHPDFAITCNNLAVQYEATGRYEEAEPLFKQTLEIRRKVLGKEHPDFATTCNDLAGLYGDTGRCEEAEPLYKQALEIRWKVLGEEHPDFATTCNDLAGLYRAIGRYEEVEPLYKQALEIYRNVLGEEHPGTTTVRENYRRFLDERPDR